MVQKVLSPREGTPLSRRRTKKYRVIIAYWILGLCNNYGYVVMLSAANDILHGYDQTKEVVHNSTQVSDTNPHTNGTIRECNHMSTGVILLADIIPSLTIKMIAPFLPFFVHVRVGTAVILASAGFLLVAFSTVEWMSVLGVVITSMSSGLGEATFLQYSSFYTKTSVSTWSSGTGGAGILGAVSYTGLSVLGLRNALLLMLVVPLAMVISFWVILPSPDDNSSEMIDMDVQNQYNEKEISQPLETLKRKFNLIPGLMKFMIPIGLVYFLEYFINQGMFELIHYENTNITKDQQYRYLQVAYQVGVFISRSSVSLIHIRNIWIFTVFQFVNVIIFSCEAVFYFIPNIWIIFALTLWEGLLGGGAYVNTFYRISREVPEQNKQFSMSITSLADAVGITLAGLLSLPAHNYICDLPKPKRLTF